MTLFPFLLLASAGLNSLAQTLLKLGAGRHPLNWYLLAGLSAYALSTLIYVVVLGKANVSLVYPIVVGLTVISTALAGVFLLRESVSPPYWLGIALILIGIFVITFTKAPA